MRQVISRTVTLALLIVVVLVQWREIHTLRSTRDALIDLNHDKSVYLDAHCENFTGTEEKLSEPAYLPGEPTQ